MKIAIQKTGQQPGFPWEWRLSSDLADLIADWTERTFEDAVRESLEAFRLEVLTEDEVVTRDNQQTDVIYVGMFAHGPGLPAYRRPVRPTVFVTPDGEGRFYYDSLTEAVDQHGSDTPIRYVSRIED